MIIRSLPILALVAATALSGAIKMTERQIIEMPGLPGVVKAFGGKALSKDGTTNMTAIRGLHMMTVVDGEKGTQVDRERKRVCEVDFKKQRYECESFEAYREKMEKAQEALAGLRGGGAAPETDNPRPEQEMELEVDIKRTGDKAVKNNVDCELTKMTIIVREKGTTGDTGIRMKMINDMWMGPDVPEKKEMAEFLDGYRKEIGLDQLSADLGSLTAMYPQMSELMEESRANQGALDGFAYSTVTEIYNYAPAGAAGPNQEEEPQSISQALGGGFKKGLGGLRGFGRKKKDKEPEPQPEPAATQPLPTMQSGDGKLVMRMVRDVMDVSTNVADSDVQIDAGFKERK